MPEAVTRYFVTQYVQARERYVAALAESDYEQVGAYHSPSMNQAWAAAWNRNSVDSPLNRHADGSTVRVQVNAVSFLKPASGRSDLAQVRFLTARAPAGQVAGQGVEEVTQYVATLQYAYGPPSKDDRVRAANPLGFKVLEYRKEPEVSRSSPCHRRRGRCRECACGCVGSAIAWWPLLLAGVAEAAVVPAPGRTDARVREIEYREDQVVSLTGYVGYHIHLELAPGETFVALGAGDSAAVDVAAEGPHVMVKPKAARVATNLTLVSSRRVYHFEYRSYEAQPPFDSAIFALRFRYPVAPSTVTLGVTPGRHPRWRRARRRWLASWSRRGR